MQGNAGEVLAGMDIGHLRGRITTWLRSVAGVNPQGASVSLEFDVPPEINAEMARELGQGISDFDWAKVMKVAKGNEYRLLAGYETLVWVHLGNLERDKGAAVPFAVWARVIVTEALYGKMPADLLAVSPTIEARIEGAMTKNLFSVFQGRSGS